MTGQSNVPTVTLPQDDYRTIHAAKILGLRNGDTIRAGLVNYCCPSTIQPQEQQPREDNHHQSTRTTKYATTTGLLTDTATIEWIPQGKVKKAEPLGNGNPPGSIRITLENLVPPPPSSQQEPTTVALLLALPRPLQLGRMLPMIAQMGVSHIVLSQAQKVPRDYFGSHLFRKPQVLRERLVEGLCQAGDVRLPKIHMVNNLKHFLQDDIDTLFPVEEYARVVTHPLRTATNNTTSPNDDEGDNDNVLRRMRHVEFPNKAKPRILLAVGPEGGWEEPDELDRFKQYHFQQVTMGSRVLRSDCAVVSLLALAHDACSV